MDGIYRIFRIDPEIQGQSCSVDLVLFEEKHSFIPSFLVIEIQRYFALYSHSRCSRTSGLNVIKLDSYHGEV